jgi:hypothetical protein
MGEGSSINIPCKIPDCKVLTHLGFKSNVLPIPLTDLSAWVGFCTSSPQQGLKCQLRSNKIGGGGGFINIPCTISDGKVLAHLRFKSKVLPRHLTDLSAWVGLYTASPQQGVKFQLINISCKTPNGKVLVHFGFRTKVLPGV